MATNRPQFWLQVRKDYIFGNFDSLISYLRQYNYTPGDTHPDYDATLDCMTRFCEDFARVILETPFYKVPDFSTDPQLDYSMDSVIRLFAATLLASNKSGTTPHHLIVALIDLIMKSGIEVSSDDFKLLFGIVLSCIRKKEMLRCGFRWNDILEPELQMGLFIVKLCHLTFRESEGDQPTRFLENKGILAIPPEGVAEIGICNRLSHEELRGEVQLSLPGFLKVLVNHEDYEKAGDFDREYVITNRLLAAQDEMRPSTQRMLRDYTDKDVFVVKVVSRRGVRIEAESIDTEYNRIRGKVWLQLPDKRPNMTSFSDNVSEGDYLWVRLSPNPEYAFGIENTFEEYYRDYASEQAGCRVKALYTGDYSKGSEWITSEGIRVGVDAAKTAALSPEDQARRLHAIRQGLPLELRLYTRPPRKDAEYFNVYAEYATDFRVASPEEAFSVEEADTVLVSQFMGEAREAGHRAEAKGQFVSFADADPRLCIPMLSILVRRLEAGLSSCRTRLEYNTSIIMLSKMLEREKELAYMEHRRRFLYAQVQFAHNSEIPPLSHDAILDGVEGVARREKIVSTLRGYCKKELGRPSLPEDLDDSENVHEKVAALVSASNSLVDIIDIMELNNIKQVIARALSIEDEYVSILDDRTFYGMESIKLEFKTSVVFPPANRRRFATAVADPDLQRWMIIKAVCGFLNSRAGGELLIGVSDEGYAVGLDDDIRELYDAGYITAPTIDNYRTYLQYMLDYAFRESSGRMLITDIARTCISYDPEENEEGKTVMRLQIKPFQGGIVSLAASASERPQGFDDCFVRLSGRTVPVTPELRATIMQYKMSAQSLD